MEILRGLTQVFGLCISHAYWRFFGTKQVYQGPLKSFCVPFFACHSCPSAVFSCPVGTFQHYMVIRQVPWIEISHLAIILIAVGRMVCGWICPVGLIQDLAYKINSFKVKIPRWVGVFRYISLAFLVLLIPYFLGELWFCKLCPSGTVEAAIPWVLWNPINPEFGQRTIDPATLGFFFVAKIVIVLVLIWLIIISKRPFCRVMCPLSVIFAVFNRISIIRMSVDQTHPCNQGCEFCLKECPMDIKVYDDPNSGECIRCLKCTKCMKVKIGIGDLTEPVAQKSL